MVIATIIAVLLFFSRIRFPEVALDSMNYVADMNTPLAMMVAGFSVAQTDILKMCTKLRVYFSCFLKLVLIPVIMIFILKIIPLPQDVAMTTLIASACPAATTGTMMAIRYKQNYTYSSECLPCHDTGCGNNSTDCTVWRKLFYKIHSQADIRSPLRCLPVTGQHICSHLKKRKYESKPYLRFLSFMQSTVIQENPLSAPACPPCLQNINMLSCQRFVHAAHSTEFSAPWSRYRHAPVYGSSRIFFAVSGSIAHAH